MKPSLKAIRGTGAVLLAVLIAASCGKREDAAASDLEEAGYGLTQEDWFRAAAANDLAAMRRFVSGNFDPATPDADGGTALHAAAAAGSVEAADYLLNRGLPIDAAGARERTPLMEAVIANRTEMVNWLLRQGADPRKKEQEGFSALLLAVREGHPGPVAELAPYHRDALDSGLLLASMLGRTEVIDTLTNYGASVYSRMEDGRTPLMLAVENGHVDSVKLLLDIGASRFTTDIQGRTAADIARENEWLEIATLLSREPRPDDFTLDSPAQLAEAMDQHVTAAAGDEDFVAELPDFSHAESGETGASGALAVVRRETSGSFSAGPIRLLQGESVSDATGARPSPAAARETPPATVAAKVPPLVMRHYRHREVPVEVRRVDGSVATLRLAGSPDREVEVGEGEAIPGSGLIVVSVRRRMEASKMSMGEPMEVSVVEVSDPVTGEVREWIAGMPAGAHDPVALLEDAATGSRYIASPGHEFQSTDGTRYMISDVRPNQVVIENRDDGTVETLPLRGPRG